MRIIIVNDYACVNGGASKVALQSAIGLAKRGHQVELFAGAGPAIPQLAKHGIGTACLNQMAYNRDPAIFRAAFRGIWNRKAARSFRAFLRERDPQNTIVHFHTFRDVLSASVGDTAGRMGFVMLYTAHEYTIRCR